MPSSLLKGIRSTWARNSSIFTGTHIVLSRVMQLRDKVAVVTGGASGIGRALCRRFAAEGARGVVVADVNVDGARQVAAEIGGLALKSDVGNEAEVIALV